jgi:solute carrier family 25 phosphate transporter 3
MPIAFPSGSALHSSFSSSNPLTVLQQKSQQPSRTKYQARSELYGAWSVADDAKTKANQLSDKAVKEFDKASAAAQAKTGQIEMYSPKFYAACTFGGLLACVSPVDNLFL